MFPLYIFTYDDELRKNYPDALGYNIELLERKNKEDNTYTMINST